MKRYGFSLASWRAASVRYDIDKLAIRAFSDYSASVGGVDRNGDRLPGGEEFFRNPNTKREADAWRAAVRVLIYKNPYNGTCWRVWKRDYNGDYTISRKYLPVLFIGWLLWLVTVAAAAALYFSHYA